MSYYDMGHWVGHDIEKEFKANKVPIALVSITADKPDGMGGNYRSVRIDDDCFFEYMKTLMETFDVMLMERGGKTFIWIDVKGKGFSQR